MRNLVLWGGISLIFTFFCLVMTPVAFCTETQSADQTATPLPYTAFSNLPAFYRPKLSPQGDKLVYVQNVNGPEELAILVTYDLKNAKNYYLLSSDNEKVKINWYRWVSNERIVISVRYESRRGTTRVYDTRLMAMNFDDQGVKPINLVNRQILRRKASNSSHVPQFQDTVIDWLPDDPDFILMAIDAEVLAQPSVFKVNVNNGKMKTVERGKRRIRRWFTDRQHNVRVGVALNYKTAEQKVLIKEDDGWRTLFSYNIMEEKGEYPLGFGLDPNILYFRGYKGNFAAIFTLNLSTNEITEVFADEGYDVNGHLIYSPATGDVVGVAHDGVHYWDKGYQALQRGINQAMSDYDNQLISLSQNEQMYVLYSESDVMPGAFFLGNREDGSLKYLFSKYPDIPEGSLSEHELVTYKARDGVEIEAYMTLPKGDGPFPTIIHPHGGPGARDFDGFDYWTAYFTNRGYAVLRPNFRGSQGYGFEFAQSQMKSWGLSMQDDITDAANWMVKQGYAEADNMCIVGASYGGYAAMMATVKTPDLFKCAVSFAGVSSLKHLVIHSRRFLNHELVKDQIGDDHDDLDARSPYYNAQGIKTPILLVHGDEDRVVRPLQSRYMADELEGLDKPFNYVELEYGDHYLSIQRNRHRFFEEMDSFLGKYLATH